MRRAVASFNWQLPGQEGWDFMVFGVDPPHSFFFGLLVLLLSYGMFAALH